jgi:hypothetical protein
VFIAGGTDDVTATKMLTIDASPRLGPTRRDDLHDLIRRRSTSLYARMRLAEAVRSLAMDIVGDDDSLSTADRAWLRQALAGPVNEATEEALRVLVAELAAAVRSAPARVRPAIVAPLVTRVDFE